MATKIKGYYHQQHMNPHSYGNLSCIAKLMLKQTRFSHNQLLLLAVMQQERLDNCTELSETVSVHSVIIQTVKVNSRTVITFT